MAPLLYTLWDMRDTGKCTVEKPNFNELTHKVNKLFVEHG